MIDVTENESQESETIEEERYPAGIQPLTLPKPVCLAVYWPMMIQVQSLHLACIQQTTQCQTPCSLGREIIQHQQSHKRMEHFDKAATDSLLLKTHTSCQLVYTASNSVIVL